MAALSLLIVAIMAAGCTTDESPPEQASQPAINPTGVVNLVGQPVDPLSGDNPTLLLFTRSDCPIANRFAPEIARLHKQYSAQGLEFYLVYVDPSESVVDIRKHIADYKLSSPALRDPQHQLVKRTSVRITPEAALFDKQGKLVYRGRIDDRFVNFNKTRPQPTKHDLEDAIQGVLDGSLTELVTTKAVGCYISDLEPADAG